MVGRIIRIALSLTVLLPAFPSAYATEANEARLHLDRILAVLRFRENQASRACVRAMIEVRNTEQQVRAHRDDPGAHPDLDLARSLLASDYQNGAQLCGADAERACREIPGRDISGFCEALRADADQ
jgi:hypothetical protein